MILLLFLLASFSTLSETVRLKFVDTTESLDEHDMWNDIKTSQMLEEPFLQTLGPQEDQTQMEFNSLLSSLNRHAEARGVGRLLDDQAKISSYSVPAWQAEKVVKGISSAVDVGGASLKTPGIGDGLVEASVGLPQVGPAPNAVPAEVVSLAAATGTLGSPALGATPEEGLIGTLSPKLSTDLGPVGDGDSDDDWGNPPPAASPATTTTRTIASLSTSTSSSSSSSLSSPTAAAARARSPSAAAPQGKVLYPTVQSYDVVRRAGPIPASLMYSHEGDTSAPPVSEALLKQLAREHAESTQSPSQASGETRAQTRTLAPLHTHQLQSPQGREPTTESDEEYYRRLSQGEVHPGDLERAFGRDGAQTKPVQLVDQYLKRAKSARERKAIIAKVAEIIDKNTEDDDEEDD